MSERPRSRRETLRDAALGAGALTAAGLLGPALAAAQNPDDEDLRDFLVGAISLEQLAVLAYAAAAREADPKLRSTLEDLRAQEVAHATALRAAMDSLGFDLPVAPDSTTDSAAFEGVEGLDEGLSEELVRLLKQLDGISKPPQYLDYLIEVEAEQLAYYATEGPLFESIDLTTTRAEIAGCQAQHMVVLGEARGEQPVAAVDRASAAAAARPRYQKA